MTAALIVSLALVAPPQVQAPVRPPDCELEVLTPQTLEELALSEFRQGVDAYVRLHRRLERYLPPEQMFDDPEEMLEASDVLAAAIRAARPNARPGIIFKTGPTQLFRTIIRNTLQEKRYFAGEMIAWLNDERDPKAWPPEVNGRYDWKLGAWMWPALLRKLPPLPPELEYRLVYTDLVIIDLRADLVVDILENAMPIED